MRKTKDVVIVASGRDEGKTFVLTEMPASQAERWATRAFLSLMRSGVDVPDEVRDTGILGIAKIGLKALAGVSYPEAIDLMDEMFSCVRIRRDKNNPAFVTTLIEEDIEEVATRIFLRSEVLELHTGFSIAGELSRFTASPALTEETGTTLPNTRTSSDQSAQ